MKVAVYRKSTFNAAHKLYVPDWSEANNKEVFGLCANPNFHGHNYRVDLKVIGEVNPITGYVIDLRLLDSIVQTEIIERFDHRNLNLDCPEFHNLNPTGENIAVVIYNLLRKKLPSGFELQVRLWETEKNYFEYPA